MRDLAAKAVQAIGIGSSITYRRYVEEDKKRYRTRGAHGDLWCCSVSIGEEVRRSDEVNTETCEAL